MTNSIAGKLNDFHTKFGLDYIGPPRTLQSDEALFRITAMSEEINEYMVATQLGDLEAQLDALVDLVYFAVGTADRQGLPFDKAFDRVHRYNMGKELASSTEASKRGFKRDIVKPEGWTAPTFTDLLERG